MFESIQTSAEVALWSLGNFVVLLAVLYAGRLAYALTSKRNPISEIFDRKNKAMAVAFGGYILGLGIAASGALLSPGPSSFIGKLALVGASGLASVILMRLSLLINDRLILSKFSNTEEIIRDQNVGVGFVEAGGCLATGFMIYAVMTCQSLSLQDKIFDGLVYWAIGQALLVIGARIYDKTLAYDAHEELKEHNNAAVGLIYGGFLMSLGLVLMTAISGATSNITDELGTIGVFYATGLLLLLAVRFAANRLVLAPTARVTNAYNRRDLGVAAIELTGILCVAILFMSSLSPANSATIFASQPASEAPKAVTAEEKVK